MDILSDERDTVLENIVPDDANECKNSIARTRYCKKNTSRLCDEKPNDSRDIFLVDKLFALA
jgi:hypothetical protein